MKDEGTALHNSTSKTMNSSPEPIKEPPDSLTKSGIKFYSIALRTSTIGCISSFILILLAISTLFFEKGDTFGPGFLIFGILAIVVLVVSGGIAIFTGLVGIANGIITLNEDKNYTEELKNGITNNVTLILGVILVLFFVYRFLKGFIW